MYHELRVTFTDEKNCSKIQIKTESIIPVGEKTVTLFLSDFFLFNFPIFSCGFNVEHYFNSRLSFECNYPDAEIAFEKK